MLDPGEPSLLSDNYQSTGTQRSPLLSPVPTSSRLSRAAFCATKAITFHKSLATRWFYFSNHRGQSAPLDFVDFIVWGPVIKGFLIPMSDSLTRLIALQRQSSSPFGTAQTLFPPCALYIIQIETFPYYYRRGHRLIPWYYERPRSTDIHPSGSVTSVCLTGWRLCSNRAMNTLCFYPPLVNTRRDIRYGACVNSRKDARHFWRRRIWVWCYYKCPTRYYAHRYEGRTLPMQWIAFINALLDFIVSLKISFHCICHYTRSVQLKDLNTDFKTQQPNLCKKR